MRYSLNDCCGCYECDEKDWYKDHCYCMQTDEILPDELPPDFYGKECPLYTAQQVIDHMTELEEM